MAFFGPHNAEINQVNAQIKAENGKISGYQYTLGVMLLKKLDEGMVFDDEIMQQYEAVKASRTAIENANAELARIQQLIAEEEAARQAEKERKQAEAATLRAARAAELAAKANSFFGKGTGKSFVSRLYIQGLGSGFQQDHKRPDGQRAVGAESCSGTGT